MTADKDKQTRQQERAATLSVPPLRRGTQLLAVLIFFLLGAVATWFALRNPLGISFLSSGGESTGPSFAGTAPAGGEPASEGKREIL